MDLLDAVRRRSWDSRFYDISVEAKAVPTMLTEEEGKMLSWLGEHYFQGKGVVVDLGCFLGGSTARLASGLKRSGRPWTLHAFDRFVIDDELKQKHLYANGHPKFEGTDMLSLFQKFTAPFGGNIVTHKGELINLGPWTKEPIEILFLDLAKDIPTHHFVLDEFFTSLIPGRSIIVQQDYIFHKNPWLITAMELLHPKIELVGWTRDYSALFLCQAALNRRDLERVRYDKLPQAAVEQLIRAARERFPFEFQREMFAVTLETYRKTPAESRAWAFPEWNWTQRPDPASLRAPAGAVLRKWPSVATSAARLHAAFAQKGARAGPNGAAAQHISTRSAPSPQMPDQGSEGNLALGKAASQSSTSVRWSRSVITQVDAAGAVNGIVDGSQGFCTESEHFPWWQVDLGCVCRLTEVRIYNRQLCAARLRRFSIMSSLDGERWVEIFRKSDTGVFGANDLAPYVARLSDDSVGRFVRIQLHGTDYLHFNECQIYGQAGGPGDVAALEGRFNKRLNDEVERMGRPAEQTDPLDIAIELSLTQGVYPFPASELKRTQDRRWILDHVPRGGIGAEVGVFRGHFSEILLQVLKPTKFYLVDPWEKLGKTFNWGDSPYTAHNSLPTAVARRDACLRVRKYRDVEIVVIEDFFPACKEQIHEPLDWLYIDASHYYDQTLAELNASAKLIKPGGLILGDDFWPKSTLAHHGVARAVNKFVSTEHFEFVAAGPFGQWCIRRARD